MTEEKEKVSKRRVEWVDIVKYICIIAVIMMHVDGNTGFWYQGCGSFLLKGFFFVSGYVYLHSKDFKGFFVKKVKGLLVPWFILSTFNILLSQVLSFNEHGNLWEEIGWNFLQIRDHGDGLWFVAALFVAFIPFYYVIKWRDGEGQAKAVPAIFLSLLLSVGSLVYMKIMPPEVFPWGSAKLPWHLEYIFEAMFFMVLGYYFKRNYEEKFDTFNTKVNRAVLWSIYLVVAFFPYVMGIEIPSVVSIPYQYIYELLGVLTVVSFSKVLKTNSYIAFVGQNTLIYFALHGKVISVIQTILNKVIPGLYGGILENTVLVNVWIIIFAIIISFILILPAWLVNKYLPFVVGRKLRKEG